MEFHESNKYQILINGTIKLTILEINLIKFISDTKKIILNTCNNIGIEFILI